MTTETIEAPAIALQIAEYSPLAAGLADLRHRFGGVVFDLSTTKGDKEARQARQELVKLRGTLEAKRKELKAPALERSRLIDDEAKRIAAEILALEQPIDEAIKAAEARKEADRQARAAAEQARLDSIQKRIRAFGSFAIRAMGESSATIRELIIELVALEPTPSVFEEFLPTAQQAHADALAGLRLLHDKAATQEMQAQQLADERAELDRQRAADEAARAERDRQEAAARAEREVDEQRQRHVEENERARVADIRERIAGFGRAVDMMAGSSAQDLMNACNAMPPPHADEFFEFLDDATAAFCAAVARLETMYQAAFDQEQQAAANARKEAELAEQQAALDRQRAEQEAAEQARRDAIAAEQQRQAEERRQQQEREDAERAEKERAAAAELAAAQARADAFLDKLHRAAPHMLDALHSVRNCSEWSAMDNQTRAEVEHAIALAEQ